MQFGIIVPACALPRISPGVIEHIFALAVGFQIGRHDARRAAIGAIGLPVFGQAAFWWCVAGIAVTGVLNLGVSFYLALKVALRSRGIRLADRSRIYHSIRARLRKKPLSFFVPPA